MKNRNSIYGWSVRTFYIGLALIGLSSCTNSLPENHGNLDLKLFTPDTSNQALIVAFGGGEGGNAWAGDYWSSVRNQFLDEGFSFLAVGYFGSNNLPSSLDRISLNAIHDSILSVQKRNPKITDKVFVMGGSKGGELVLNLAARYSDISGVVAIVPSHVSFPANTVMANTSSWTYEGDEVSFVPAPFRTIFSAMRRDLHRAFSIMLEDEEAVERATIEVEKINGPLLILSASEDEMWPSTQMSNNVINRLERKGHPFQSTHLKIEGSHSAPLDHFDKVLEFLIRHAE